MVTKNKKQAAAKPAEGNPGAAIIPGAKPGALKPRAGSTALDAPAYIREGAAGRGLENVKREDITMPRLVILQPQSPEVLEKGMKEGHIINNVTMTDYGDSIVIVPILHSKSRIYWQDRDEGGGQLCASDDGLNPRDCGAPCRIAKMLKMKEFPAPEDCTKCPFHTWDNEAEKKKDQRPKCTMYYNFPVLINKEMEPVALSLERTKVAAAKKLITLCFYNGSNLDAFAKAYRITTYKDKNDQGSWFNVSVEAVGWAPEAQFLRAKEMWESLHKTAIKLDQDQPKPQK
jgi:hypothetical protein